MGEHPRSSRLHLAISLPVRDTRGLADLLKRLYDPRNPSYRQFLTPSQFTERFGPTEADYQALQDFAVSHNLRITSTYSNRRVLDVEGQTPDIETAFHVHLNDFRRPDGSLFHGPDQEPSVDSDVRIEDVHGLDNEFLPKPRLSRPSPRKQNVSPHLGGSGPGGNFFDTDYRNAYASGVTLTGAGQSVALVEFTVYAGGDITTYENNCSPPLSVPLTNVYLDGDSSGTAIDCSSTDGDPEVEVALDIEMVISMAPGLKQVAVYMGDNEIDVLDQIASDGGAGQISCSWGWDPDRSVEDGILAQFAAQGQSYFLASGDGNPSTGIGAFTSDPPYGDTTLGNDDEIDQTLVGATALSMTGGGAAWSSESAVPLDNNIAIWQSTGGILAGAVTGDAIPSYQTGINMSSNDGSVTYRNVPDVSCVGLDVYIYDSCFGWGPEGGTSAAAPLWAGFMALANQQAAAEGRGSVGFANPSLYSIGKGSDYDSDFHDITTGNNGSVTQFPAVTGYDLATGWGSPNGQSLINDLVASLPTVTPTRTATHSPTPTPTKTPTLSPTPSFTPTVTATPTDSFTPCGYPGDTCTPTFTDTPTATFTATPPALVLSANLIQPGVGSPLTISYHIFTAGEVKMGVYNVAGEIVRHLLDQSQSSGFYTLAFNGLDDRGDPLSSGLYLVLLSQPSGVEVKKLLVVRP